MSMFDLEGRVAIVTGSVGLLGKAHCHALRKAGAHVVVTDLDEQACAGFAEELASETYADPDNFADVDPTASSRPLGNVMAFAADITRRESLEALRDAVFSRFGGLHILVNNAAINDKFEDPEAAADLSRFENYPLELFERSLKVNVTGMFLSCQVLGTALAEHTGSANDGTSTDTCASGSIINVASTYGIVAPDQSLYRTPDGKQPFYKSPSYPTTKGAVIQFTRFLAAYWGAAGVRVNALCPGGVQAGQEKYFVDAYSRKTPLGRMAQRDDYEGAVVFLASEASRYMTGATLVVDGGFTVW